jgi:hypothetical protein
MEGKSNGSPDVKINSIIQAQWTSSCAATFKVVSAVGLLGARCVLTGIRPAGGSGPPPIDLAAWAILDL